MNALNRLLFASAPASRVAALRVIVGLFSLSYLLPRYDLLTAISQGDPELFRPVGVAFLLDDPLPPGLFHGLVLLTLGLNALFVIGWRYRVSGPAFALCLLAVLSYRNSWSMIYHSNNVLLLHVCILAATPAANAWSVDALARRESAQKPSESWRYGWPVQLICIVTVITYVLAGVAKVVGPLGWSWAAGEALRSHVAVDALRKDLLGSPGGMFARQLYPHVGVFWAMGIATLVLELAAPVALLHRRLGRIWAVLTFAFHWGIYFVMGIKFRYYLSGAIFAPFFDVERIAEAGRRLRHLAGHRRGQAQNA